MATNVKFLKGLNSEYTALVSNLQVDLNTFYYTYDNNQLYLGTIKLSNAADLSVAVTRITQNELDISFIQEQLQELVGSDSGSISDMINAALNPVVTSIGSLDDLSTSAKTSLVEAINEVHSGNSSVEEAGKVTIISDNEDYAKNYIVKQGSTIVGTINVPKDMVVKSGQVVVNPPKQPSGTYIELTLQNTTNDKIYINVGTLVDIYTAEENAAEIQLSMVDREISATIVNGSVTANKIANNAITTAKIVDANVTKAKLSVELQNSIDKADSAVQTITSGSTQGTINVDGNPVEITGLGSAAFLDEEDITRAADRVEEALNTYKSVNDAKVNQNTASIEAINNEESGILAQAKAYADSQDTAKDTITLNQAKAYADGLSGNYATAAQGTKADTALQKEDIVEGSVNGAISVKGSPVSVHGLGGAAYKDESAFELAGSVSAAAEVTLNSAKAYTDSALTWGSIA